MKNINGRYVILEELGKGGFGIVYKVRDLQDSTIPYKALKLFNSDKNPGKFDDFFAEYDYISSIYLPCVVITYDFARIHHIDGEVFNGNYYFYIMEYVDGISLRDYLFIDKEERSQVLDKIVFNLKWLHGNGYSHGDLRPENIIIKMNRDIVFLDLMQNGNIDREYEAFCLMLADEYSYEPDKYWDEAGREELLNNIFSALQGRKKTGGGLIKEPVNAVLNNITAQREIRHGLNVNLANFPDEYFILFLSRLRTLLVREGYEIIEVVPNLDMYALIRDLYLKLRENPVYSNSIDADSPLLRSLPSDYNFNDSFDINTAFEIVCSLIRSAASAKKVALFIMNTGHCDKNSLEILKRAMGKPFRDAFIIFNNKTLTDVSSQEKPLIIDYTNPIGIEYSDGYRKVIEDIFLHEKTGFPGMIFRKNDSPDLLSVLKYIQSLRADDTAKVIKDGMTGYDAAVYQQRIFESLASDRKYFDVLLYMYYMDTPVRNIFLSELTGSSYPAVKNELLSTGIALPCAEDKILFANELFIKMTKAMAAALSEQDVLRLNANIIKVYESHIDSLSTNEIFSLAYSHYICGNTSPIREFFEKHIIFNRQMSPELSGHKYGWLIDLLVENGPTADPGFDRLVYIVNAIVMDADDKDKWLGKLIKAEDDPDFEDDYKAVIISKLFRYYYVAGESDKMLIQIKKLESLPAASERADLRFEVIFSRIRYYFRTGDIEKCIGLCRQAMNDDYDNDPEVNIRKLQLYYFYVQYYQGKSQTRQVGAVLSHLYRRAVKTGQSRLIHRAHELYGLYYEKLGLFDKSKIHHKLAVEEAEKFRDYYILTFSYNNLAVRESDVSKKIEYLYKALQYAEHSHELRGELLILSNLLAAVETDTFLKIIREYENIIFSKDFSDHMILEVRLRLYFNISLLLNESGETALLLRIKEIAYSIKLSKKHQQTKYLLDLLKVRLRLMMDGYDKKVFGMIFDLLKYPSFEYIDLLLDLLFSQVIKHVSFEEFRPFADKIFSFYKDNQGLFNDDGFFAFYNLAYDARADDPIKVIRYVDMYYRNQSNTPFIRDYILLRYAAALKKTGDETYVNYLSCFCNLQKKDRRDISRIKINFNILYEMIHAEFSEHYDTILSGITECSVNPGGFEELITNFRQLYSSDMQHHSDKVLKHLMISFNYQRAMVIKNKFGEFFEETSKVLSRFVYTEKDTPIYDRYLSNIDDESLRIDVDDEDTDLTGVMILPIVNRDYWVRAHNEKKYSRAKKSTPKDYLYGFIYMDKKHNISQKGEQTNVIANLVDLYLSEFWQNRLAEERFMKDRLTGLLFRDVFFNKVAEYLYEDNENIRKKTVSLLMIDIDDFKSINDIYGHQRGDAVLKEISAIILRSIRAYDIAGRYGGEEFIIALPNTMPEDALKVSERIRANITESNIMGRVRTVSVSIGMSCYPSDSLWLEELTQKADKRLYEAKARGKNRVVFRED